METKLAKFEKHVPYEVDFEYLNEKIEFSLSISEQEPQKKSFRELITFFKNKTITEPISEVFGDVIIQCEHHEYLIHCKNLVAREILSIILDLQNEKKSIWCEWYFYDNDCCSEMPQESNSFFLADQLKIVKEKVIISTSIMDEFDPNILIQSSVVMSPYGIPLWANMEADQEATAKWYYQKFYKETTLGQILFIRENNQEKNEEDSVNLNSFYSNITSELSSVQMILKCLLLVNFLILLKTCL